MKKSFLFLKKEIILSLLFLGGFLLSWKLTVHTISLKNGVETSFSFCHITPQWDCDQVAHSPYAFLTPSLPLSAVASLGNLFCFFLSLLSLIPSFHQRTLCFLWLLEMVSVCVGLFYAGIMILVIKKMCAGCIGIDFIHLSALCFLSFFYRPWKTLFSSFSTFTAEKKQWLLFVLIGILTALFLVFQVQALWKTALTESEINEWVNKTLRTPPVFLPIRPENPSFGNPHAPIQIIEYSDFQCPFCQEGALSLHTLLKEDQKNIKVIFKNFPLDQKCNHRMIHTMHPLACQAAQLGLCAHQFHQFEDVSYALFKEQDLWSQPSASSPSSLKHWLKNKKFFSVELENCLNSSEGQFALHQDIEEATAFGIQNTPTFFINGHRLEGALPITIWKKLIQVLLKKQRDSHDH